MPTINSICPCGSSKPFKQCCSPFIHQLQTPNNAEQLMRSRFCAFKLREHQYIIDTQDIQGQPKTTVDSFDLNIEWLGLYVLSHHSSVRLNWQQVEFVAFFKQQQSNQVEQLHELSDFEIRHDQWFYVSGRPLADYKIPRNTPCFCQSGKKYKKCHALS